MTHGMRMFCTALAAILLLSAWTDRIPDQPSQKPGYGRIDIRNMGHEALAAVKADSRIHWWMEVRDVLLVRAQRDELASLGAEILPVQPNDANLVVISAHQNELAQLDGHILARSSRYCVVLLNHTPDPDQLDLTFHGGHGCHSRWLAFEPDTVLGCRDENMPPREKTAKRAEIETLLSQLDGYRWFEDMYKLHCLSRHSASDQIVIARDFLVESFEDLGLSVSLQDFPNGNLVNQNVIATLTGTERPDEIYVIGAHYDSISSRNGGTPDQAPGAEDNASGTAAVLEMARVLVANPPAATVVFIAFSGEEQFLVGSQYYVDQLVAANEETKIQAALIMDMIAYTSDQVLNIDLESFSSNQDLMNLFADAAANYTELTTRFFTSPSGSDHMPFINMGIPGLLIIQSEYASYPGYHRTTDTTEHLGIEQGLEVLKMNLATLAGLIY